ncbi:hypothetical protein J4429_00460 [Candidatus Pacearchaeota archaeon]|nr:hypothetical protein [uncultured archaeon]AQS32564.1 hypothetical protein [uncultured archaeon]AQS33066.1 hypothetical protein [uncultured archaeon]MBS3074909.1 hypothetical protein [Candidatus Pacearchaeota archaeon]
MNEREPAIIGGNYSLGDIIDAPKDFVSEDYPKYDHEGELIQEGFYQLRDSSGKIIPGSIAHIKDIHYQWEDPRTDYGISTPKTDYGISTPKTDYGISTPKTD